MIPLCHVELETFIVCPLFACQQAVHTLIALQQRYLDSLGKLTPAEEDAVWQVIIRQRAQVSSCCLRPSNSIIVRQFVKHQ